MLEAGPNTSPNASRNATRNATAPRLGLAEEPLGSVGDARRLQTADDVKVMAVMSVEGCAGLAYHMDTRVLPMEQSIDVFGNMQMMSTPAFLDTTMCMDDPECVMLSCFFGGPQEFPITMNEQYPLIETPTLITQTLHRGATNVMTMVKTSSEAAGHMTWTSTEEASSLGLDPEFDQVCPTLEEAQAANRWITVDATGGSEEFVLDQTTGEYYLCFLDDAADAVEGVPLRSIGTFTIQDVVSSMEQSTQASTRTTLRLDIAALIPGEVTCVSKTVAATEAKQPDFNSIALTPGMSQQAILAAELQQRTLVYDWLLGEDGTLARATVSVPPSLPPLVTITLAMSIFPDTTEVPTWCWHSATIDRKIVVPADPLGMMFELPGENPKAHFLPSFLWPGASYAVWIEHVPDTSNSRVQMVNKSADCADAKYDAAVPVIQVVEGSEQFIEAYLLADPIMRAVCFFELSTSAALHVEASIGETDVGDAFEFSTEALPTRSFTINLFPAEYVHRGMTVNVIMTSVDPGENGQIFLITDTLYEENGDACLPAIGVDAETEDLEATDAWVDSNAMVPLMSVSPIPGEDVVGHFFTLDQGTTATFTIGNKYTLCYVGSTEDSTRIFNKIGESIEVRDIITNLTQDLSEAEEYLTNSMQTSVIVTASMEGLVSCMVTTRPAAENAPVVEEIRGTYATELPEALLLEYVLA